MILGALQRIWLAQLRRQGLQMARDCRVMGFPNFGSEPFLISIGEHVTISTGVTFVNHDGGTYVFRHLPGFENVIKFGRITVLENCFIGAHATLMPGIVVGPNAVVAAGAVVTKDVAPDTVVGGVPAKALCSVRQYAASALEKTPAYDRAAFERAKREELLRLYPRPW